MIDHLAINCADYAKSQEFWHALDTFGVPTSFVVYAGEGHGIRQPAHRKDITKRTVEWYDRYLMH